MQKLVQYLSLSKFNRIKLSNRLNLLLNKILLLIIVSVISFTITTTPIWAKTKLDNLNDTQNNLAQQTKTIAQAKKVKTKQISTNKLNTCVNSDCNCKDFKTQKEAQLVFNAFSKDIFRLDRDKDGIACESLPAN